MNILKKLLSLLLNPRARLASLPGAFDRSPDPDDDGLERPQYAGTWGFRLRHILTNIPLLIGGIIVLGLFLVILFGPLWAPRNPYIAGQHIVPHYDSASGEWISPPLAPSPEYPLGTNQWGNDILSMLLYGARNTLIAAAFIAMVRVLLGLILGAYAGWHEGSWPDQAVMGAIGVVTAVPMLISSMILIFALDIRRGLPVFIAALALVGWTEIAQYIRSEFLVLRKMPFIEGARAVGAPNLAIAVRHILPNILPQLLVITFLEVGAVLMLLGELAFIGVFIGGGTAIGMGDEITGVTVVNLADIPEWGAMLAEGYRWLRAKPFIVFPPALAFFIAVAGFNAFGEGLRRLLEQHHVNTSFLLRKRMLLVIAALTFATVFIINNTGPAPWFARVAQAFDGQSAYGHAQALAAFDRRGAGQEGAAEAAAYIVEQFAGYGLQPGWKDDSYIYPMQTTLVHPRSQPVLALTDAQGERLQTFRHQLDFGYTIDGHGGSGDVTLPLTFVGFRGSTGSYDWESFAGLDLRERIVLLLEGNAPLNFAEEALIRGARGILWVAGEDPAAVRSQNQFADPEQVYLRPPHIPIFRIRPGVAAALLEPAGLSQADLFDGTADQRGSGWFARDLDTYAHLSLELGEPQTVTVPAVLGYLPGSDYEIKNEMVVLFAGYDSLPTEPDGTTYPAANSSASATAVLLEIARVWQEQQLEPRRTVLFVAWGGSHLEQPGATQLLNDSRAFSQIPANEVTPFGPRVVVQLENLGAGGDALTFSPQSNSRLRGLLQGLVEEAGVPVQSGGDADPLRHRRLQVEDAAWLGLAWEESAVPPDQDTAGRLDPEKLQTAGELLSHALTTIVRQGDY